MTPQIKQRIEQIWRGEVPEGYKKTKIGIVPIEWEDTLFSDLFTSTSDYTDNLNKYPLYSLTIEDGITAKTERYERSHLVKKENAYKIVRPNDFAYNPMNVRFGAVARHKGTIDVAVSGYYDIFTTRADSDLEFMDSFLISDHMITYYNKVSIGSLIEKQRVHFSQFMDFKLPMPSEKERKKIAEILSAQDKLIALKEKLIEEKKRQKKALMQQLLTGKKRLPRFSGEWEAVILSKISKKITEKNTEFKYDIVFSNSAQNGIIPQIEQFDKDIANDDNIDKYYIVRNGCFVYNPRISVTAPCGPINVNHNLNTGVMSPLYTVFTVNNKNVDNEYLEQYFKSTIWFRYMKSVANYGARHDRMSITDDDFFNMPIKLGGIKEQIAIRKILLSADSEIALLQKYLDQEKQKKKVLMQLLLTGIVRV